MESFAVIFKYICREIVGIKVFVEEWVIKECKELKINLDIQPGIFVNNSEARKSIDYIITLGGDGTILWASK